MYLIKDGRLRSAMKKTKKKKEKVEYQEQTQELCIHFDTEEHRIGLDEFALKNKKRLLMYYLSWTNSLKKRKPYYLTGNSSKRAYYNKCLCKE